MMKPDPIKSTKSMKYWVYTKSNLPPPSTDQIHVLVVVPDHGLSDFTVGDVVEPVTPSMILNPPALVRFWEALGSDKTQIEQDALISLPKEVFILGNSTIGSHVYVRHCYPRLLETCMGVVHHEKTPHLVILGNPGIGKTFFGYMLLHHFAQIGATVVYQSGRFEKRFLFSGGLVAQGSEHDFVRTLDLPTTYYIADAVKPADSPAKTILLTPPRPSVWHEYSKTKCDLRYMPVWSLEEILMCRGFLYQDLDLNLVNSHFRRWGGIARFVLEYAAKGNQQQLLEKAVHMVNVDSLVDACGKLDANDGLISHKLLHIRVDEAFNMDYFVFASAFVRDEVYKCLYKNDKRKLLRFIAAADGDKYVSVLRGHLFEGHVHSVLPRGGQYRIRHLVQNEITPAAVETIALPPLETLEFLNQEEVAGAAGDFYFRPCATNFQSVDAFIRPDILLQITAAHKYPCKQQGLHSVLALLGNPQLPRLYFVVPPDRFNNFRYQSYLDSKGTRKVQPTFTNMQTLQQYVLEVAILSSD